MRKFILHLSLVLGLFLISCKSSQTSKISAPSQDDGNTQIGFPDVSSVTPEMGGSNYAFIELGRYAENPTEENWASDVKTPVTHFHERPQKVKEQLDFMIQNGQKKIAVIVWFGGPGLTCDFHMHTVCPQNGNLPLQARENLQKLLVEISQRPFSEVQIRLAGQGTADIHGWTKWEESIYLSNRNFIFNVIEHSEDVLSKNNIKVLYDLGLELMGHPHIERSWYKQYLIKIWQEYIKQYPIEKTIGFSFNHAHRNAFYESLKVFDNSGKKPLRLGVDLYVDRVDHLQNIAWILDLIGWGKNYPIYIQETYRNDAQVANEILDARKNLGLNIVTVIQWPLDQNSVGHTNSVDYTFDNYK